MRKAEGWDAVTVDADLEFHRAVGSATGNAYIASFIGFISDQVREAIATTRCRQRPGALHACDEHGRVYEAIARGDPRTAREAMERHNMEAARRLKVEL